MTRHVLPSILLCSAVGLFVPIGVARSQESSAKVVEGRAHFRRGVDFFKEGDYRAALLEFKRAYEQAPNYKVLYNLGQTSLELQDYASALRWFERYLADGGRDIAAARRKHVDGEIDKLKKRVARLEVITNVPDAEIFVDDVAAGRTPLPAALAVSAGRRKISASKGGITVTRAVDVIGGDSTTLTLEIVEPQAPIVIAPPPSTVHSPDAPPRGPEPAARLAPEPTATIATDGSPRPRGLWIGITATGALGAGTVATGILALSAKKDFDATVGRYGVDPRDVDDARTRTRTLALVTDILAGATLVAGGITVVMALRGSSSSKDSDKAVRVSVTPGGLVASGAF